MLYVQLYIITKKKLSLIRYGPAGGTPEIKTGDCVLPLNLLNTKIYTFMFFWLIILTVLTSLTVLYRIYTLTSLNFRQFLMMYWYGIKIKENDCNKVTCTKQHRNLIFPLCVSKAMVKRQAQSSFEY